VIEAGAPVETDWKFWAHHVLHWHALLLAVASVIFFTKNLSS